MSRSNANAVKGGRWSFVSWLGLSLLLIAVAAFAYRTAAQQKLQRERAATRQIAQQAADDGEVARAAELYRELLKTGPNDNAAAQGLQTLQDELRADAQRALARLQLVEAERLIAQMRALDEKAFQSLRQQLELRQREQQANRQLAEIESLIGSGSLDDADEALAGFVALDERQRDRQSTLRKTLDDARKRAQAERVERENQERQYQRERARRDAQTRAQQRARKAEYLDQLASARRALADGDVRQARAWLDKAQSLQTDSAWQLLDTRVTARESFEARPLSDYELSYAAGRFNSLRRAVETRNLNALQRLIVMPSDRLAFFENLFKRYVRLKASVIDIEAKKFPKRVQATLRLEELGLPNGDVVYPSPSYRDLPMSVTREYSGWSKVRW